MCKNLTYNIYIKLYILCFVHVHVYVSGAYVDAHKCKCVFTFICVFNYII